MRRIILGLAAFVAFAIPVGASPILNIPDGDKVNLGEVWIGDDVSHAFTIENIGDELLEIKKVKPG